MPENKYASIKNQLENSICEVDDTEEMFVLRESEDFDSFLSLGNALARQYRFREAIPIYEKALSIKPDNALVCICLGGAHLSLFRFDEAKKYYDLAAYNNASIKSVSYPLGIRNYLLGQYEEAAECFAKCLPCEGEMKIAVIYWHTLCAVRGGFEKALMKEYDSTMDVGHHEAYKSAVSVFAGDSLWNEVSANNPLDSVVLSYGLYVYLKDIGETIEADREMAQILENESVWPCVSYLAAYNDCVENR